MMDRFSQDAAAVALGLVLAVIVVGVIILALDGTDTPDLLEVIGGGALGALAALAQGKRSG